PGAQQQPAHRHRGDRGRGQPRPRPVPVPGEGVVHAKTVGPRSTGGPPGPPSGPVGENPRCPGAAAQIVRGAVTQIPGGSTRSEGHMRCNGGMSSDASMPDDSSDPAGDPGSPPPRRAPGTLAQVP